LIALQLNHELLLVTEQAQIIRMKAATCAPSAAPAGCAAHGPGRRRAAASENT